MKTPQNADSMYLDCGIMYKFDFLLCFNVFSKFTILSYWSGASAGSLAEARLFSPPGLSCIARTPTPPPRPPAPPRPACWCCAPGKACERGGAAGARRLWRGRAEQAAQRSARPAAWGTLQRLDARSLPSRYRFPFLPDGFHLASEVLPCFLRDRLCGLDFLNEQWPRIPCEAGGSNCAHPGSWAHLCLQEEAPWSSDRRF